MLLYGAPKPRRYAHHRTHCTAAMQDRLRNVERNRRLLESLGLLDVNLTKKSASQHRVCAWHSLHPRPRPARVPLSKCLVRNGTGFASLPLTPNDHPRCHCVSPGNTAAAAGRSRRAMSAG